MLRLQTVESKNSVVEFTEPGNKFRRVEHHYQPLTGGFAFACHGKMVVSLKNLCSDIGGVEQQKSGNIVVMLEAGEHPLMNPIEYILESIKTIYSIKHKNGAIRRVNVNIAATTVENYRKLRDAGIGTYILFQETYNKENYLALHPTGPKSNYEWHTEAMDRAMQGGIDDVGIGVLFGLETYRYDLIGLLMHAEHLEATYGVGPHTISVPRLCKARNILCRSRN